MVNSSGFMQQLRMQSVMLLTLSFDPCPRMALLASHAPLSFGVLSLSTRQQIPQDAFRCCRLGSLFRPKLETEFIICVRVVVQEKKETI